MKVRAPSFPFYADKWLSDPGLRSCSASARGIWADMICVMHMSPRYGYMLKADRTPFTIAQLGALNHMEEAQCGVFVSELEFAAVFSRTTDGVIYCRKMLRDFKERSEWRKRQQKHRDIATGKTVMSRECHVDVTASPIPSPSLIHTTSPLPPAGGCEEGILKKCHKCNFEGLSLSGHECSAPRKSFSQQRSNGHEQTQRESPAERSSRQTREQAQRVAAMLSAGSK